MACRPGRCPGPHEPLSRDVVPVNDQRPDHRRRPASSLQVASLFVAQGLPFGLLTEAMPVFLATHGMGPATVGAVGTLQLAWTLKFLWSGFVARVGGWRRWMTATLVVMSLTLLALAAGIDSTYLLGGRGAVLGVVLLAVFALASATQDVATDGAFVRLVDPSRAGIASGWRVSAYRVAMLVGGGGAAAASTLMPWRAVLVAAAVVLLVLTLVPRTIPAAVESRGPSGSSGWRPAVMPWLRQPGAAGTLALLLLYKFGDSAMSNMVKPFWVARGHSAAEIAGGAIGVGLGGSILGALWGGSYITRHGIMRALWVLGLWQASSNLGYAAVALADLGNLPLYAASLFESITQGLGTAALVALTTQLCDRAHATVQFALLTAVASLGRALSLPVGGLLAAALGFGPFFLLSFFFCLPALALLPATRRRLAAAATAASAPAA